MKNRDWTRETVVHLLVNCHEKGVLKMKQEKASVVGREGKSSIIQWSKEGVLRHA